MSSNVISILKSLEKEEKELRRERNLTKNFDFCSTIAMVVTPFSAIFFLILYKWFKFDILITLSYFLLFFSYIIPLLYPIIRMYFYRKTIIHHIKYPFSTSLDANIFIELEVDTKYSKQLSDINSEDLELALLELEHERNFLERRILLIIGPVSKLGILPGILAGLAMAAKIGEQYSWVQALAYASVALQPMAILFDFIIMRYERMIKLIKHVLNKKH